MEHLRVYSVRWGGGGGVTLWLNLHGTVEEATHGVADASLLSQQLCRHLASEYSLWTAVRVRLAAIPSTEEDIQYLGMCSFVALYLLFVGGRHSSAVAELLCLIERLEELCIEVQGMISSPHLSMTLMYDVSLWCSLYLNRFMAASAS